MTKTTNTSKKHDIFQRITHNALDFIQVAVDEFDKSPKYSLIHFATGIELILKARLAYEHWTLVVDKMDIDKVSHASLVSGESRTVTTDNSKHRISHLFSTEVKKEAFDIFEKLAKYRNRAIHFELPKNEKETVAKIQCQAWYYLHELFTDQWQHIFGYLNEEIDKLNSFMMRHRKYLEEKYKKVELQITNNKNKGIVYTNCPSCGFDSSRCFDVVLGEYFSFPVQKCEVCELDDTFPFRRKCPKCGKGILLSGEQEVSCQHCHYAFSAEGLCNALDIEGTIAWCGNCEDHTVVALYGDWFCTSCFDKFESDEGHVKHCEYCNELIADKGNGHYHDDKNGTERYDYYEGCFLCGGMREKVMSDDRY